MLRKFTVSNFKNFNSEITLDLTSGRYDFNREYVRNKINNISIIYGYNACGKSNLMLAIFDITATLTDNNKDPKRYLSYQNVKDLNSPAVFSYEFVFGSDVVVYSYSKSDYFSIVSEKLTINDKVVLERLPEASSFSVSLLGTETLDKNLTNKKISAVKYVNSNANLPDAGECVAFKKFMDFVNRMLLFWCLQERSYIGFENGTSVLLQSIYEAGHLDTFNEFLLNMKINRKIIKKEDAAGQPAFYYDYGDGNLLPYSEYTPSNGEKALLLFFYWYSKEQEEIKPSIIAIDEFDAFYHIDMAKSITRILGKSCSQVILTSHNPSLISNEILRPDCYYLLEGGELSNFSSRTEKDIRQAHNLERMFKAGEFKLNE